MDHASSADAPARVPKEISIEQWSDRLEATLRGCTALRNAMVLRETASTQDAARGRGPSVGDVVTAWRQTAGRGRMGRAWADTGADGVACTMVVPPESSERLLLISAVAAHTALTRVCERGAAAAPRLGIKWPNDIVAGEGKLAGILVETLGGSSLIGVGVNVRQRAFDAALANRAVSLLQLGVDADRIDVICELVHETDRWLRAADSELLDRYKRASITIGARHLFHSTTHGTVQGTVVDVDPAQGLLLETQGGRVLLPAATTTIVAVDSSIRPT